MWYIEYGDARMEIVKEGIIRLSMLERHLILRAIDRVKVW